MKRVFSILMVCCLLLSLFTACNSKKTNGYIVSYDFTHLPKTLDPQLATSSEALMIIENTFEGLLRKNADGELMPGVATGYTVSDDKLTYTFNLRQNAMWSDGKTHVTAADFVFAFTRVVEPDTFSPGITSFLCIKNAQEIYAGRMPASKLGVEATDEHTLTVHLDVPSPFFAEAVTSAAAMPCNEKFFRLQKGRYGLEPSYLLYNGPFFVRSYDPENRIKLRANNKYHSETPTVAGGVDFIFQFDDKPDKEKPDAVLKTGNQKVLERIYTGRTDAAPVSYSDVSPLKEKTGAQIYSFENTSWGLLLNCSGAPYDNESIRRAIALSVDYSELEPFFGDNLSPANALVPPAVKLLDKPYRKAAGENLRPHTDTALAKALLAEGFAASGITKLPKTSIIFDENMPLAPMLSVLQRQLQNSLGVYINLEALPQSELRSRIRGGDYTFAVAAFSANSNSPDSILNCFTSKSPLNVCGYFDYSFEKKLEEAMVAEDILKAAELYKSAEEVLLNSGVYIPLCYETSYFASSAGLHGVSFSPFSYKVFFKLAYNEG
ncbi:MAG: peptide ABC transporter substrate-binding protein [Hydrogenoanaerobacterium sp.]